MYKHLFLLTIMILFCIFIGTFHISYKDSFINNYYTLWDNEIKTFGINPPGVMSFVKKGGKCSTDTNQLVQYNVTFRPERIGDSCTTILFEWPEEFNENFTQNSVHYR